MFVAAQSGILIRVSLETGAEISYSANQLSGGLDWSEVYPRTSTVAHEKQTMGQATFSREGTNRLRELLTKNCTLRQILLQQIDPL